MFKKAWILIAVVALATISGVIHLCHGLLGLMAKPFDKAINDLYERHGNE